MKAHRFTSFFARIAALLLLGAGVSFAQDTFGINLSAITGGGGLRASSGQFTLSGAIGQFNAGTTPAGPSQFDFTGGFWTLPPGSGGNADLAGLIISAGGLSPSFDPAITSYTTTVSTDTASFTVSPFAVETAATLQVRINGGSYFSVANGGTTAPMALNPGDNPINVLVTSANTTSTKTYTLTVTRTPPGTPGEVEALDASVAGYTVNAILSDQQDRTIIAGNIVSVQGTPRTHLARLLADGSLDAGFNPQVSADVYTATVQADGDIVFGGTFTTVNGQARSRLARVKPNGTLDTAFNPAPAGDVLCVVPEGGGRLYIGGGFTTVGGQSRPYLARLNSDGALDTSFAPSIGAVVYTIAVQPDGKVLVGGGFTSAGGQTRNYIARFNLNGTLDTAFDPNANSFVTTINVLRDGNILLGGYFTSMGAQSRPYLARVSASGALDNSFQPAPSNAILGTAVQADGKLLCGGTFTVMGGQTRNRIARLNANGTLDTAFAPDANGTVFSVSLQPDGKVLLGGEFFTVNGTIRNRFARISNDLPIRPLTVPSATSVLWTRGGSAPEFTQVSFEVFSGGAWTQLSQGTRVGTTANWQFNGYNLTGTSGTIRARGRTAAGYLSASGSQIEQQRTYDFFSADSDGDGMADGWEMENFGNLAQTASGDYDGDARTNLTEFTAGTNPQHHDALPADTNLVNIDARAHGSGSYLGDATQSLWYQPAATAPSITLPAGTYAFRVINPADAAAMFPSLTTAQLAKIYSGWTWNSPWAENYMVFKSTALTNSSEHQIFDGAVYNLSYGSAAAAYAGCIADVTYNKIRPAPPGRAGGPTTYLTKWTFTATTKLLFTIPDNGLFDNGGGVSVLITPAAADPPLATALPRYPQAVLAAGPVAYWRFDETGGSTAADSAGAFPGTLSPNGATFARGGISGNAINLIRGAGGLVNMGTSVPGFTSGDYSIVMWVKNTETVINTIPLAKHTANSQNGYLIQINQNSNGGALNKATFTAGAQQVSQAPTSTSNVNDGRWHQIVAVYRAGSTNSIHVDGTAAQASRASLGMPGNSAPFLIGGITQGTTPTAYYTGLVDEVALFNRALTNAEIAALYEAANPAVIWDLRAHWSDAVNPNSVWRYNEGNNALPRVNWWQQTLGGWTAAQPGWARSQDGNNRLPFWFRSNGSENFGRDFAAGDVVVHTTDPTNGVGNGEGNVTWTSPITGTISITGGVWMGRDIGRSATWTLSKNNVVLTDGAIASGDQYNRVSPFTYALGRGGPGAVTGLNVVPGDVIKLQLVRTSTGGDFVGVDLAIATTLPFEFLESARNAATGLTTMTFPAQLGATYSLWGSTDFTSWTQRGPSLPGTGATVTATDTPPAPTSRYFYQIQRN